MMKQRDEMKKDGDKMMTEGGEMITKGDEMMTEDDIIENFLNHMFSGQGSVWVDPDKIFHVPVIEDENAVTSNSCVCSVDVLPSDLANSDLIYKEVAFMSRDRAVTSTPNEDSESSSPLFLSPMASSNDADDEAVTSTPNEDSESSSPLFLSPMASSNDADDEAVTSTPNEDSESSSPLFLSPMASSNDADDEKHLATIPRRRARYWRSPVLLEVIAQGPREINDWNGKYYIIHVSGLVRIRTIITMLPKKKDRLSFLKYGRLIIRNKMTKAVYCWHGFISEVPPTGDMSRIEGLNLDLFGLNLVPIGTKLEIEDGEWMLRVADYITDDTTEIKIGSLKLLVQVTIFDM